MKERFLKRVVAVILTLCLVFGQGFVPAGLIDVDLSGVLSANAETTGTFESTWSLSGNSSTTYKMTYTYSDLGNGKAAIIGISNNDYEAAIANAPDGSYFDVTFPSTIPNTALKVTQLGTSTANNSAGALITALNVASVTIPDSVETIAPYAFYNTPFESVTIEGTTLKEVGNSAFSACLGLTSITFPASVTTLGDNCFSNSTALTSVTVEDGKQNLTIGKYCFSKASNNTVSGGGYCTKLSHVSIPDTTSSLGAYAFYQCSSLEEFSIPSGVTQLEEGCFAYSGLKGDLNLSGIEAINVDITATPNQGVFEHCTSLTGINLSGCPALTSIPPKTFKACTGVTGALVLPDAITQIGAEAFSGCSSLYEEASSKSLSLPKKLSFIGNSAFSNCGNFTTINWNNAPVSSIGESAFASNSSLEAVVIPTSFTTTVIPTKMFNGCSRLAGITLPNTFTEIGSSAFEDTPLANVQFYDTDPNKFVTCSAKNTSQLETIGSSAFAGTSISGFYFPDNITIVESDTFNNAKNFQTVDFNNVTTIKNSAFAGTALTSLALSDKIVTIEAGAFAACNALTTVDLSQTKITQLSGSTFSANAGSSTTTTNTTLKSVSLPSTLTSIGVKEFQNRAGLTTVVWPSFSTTVTTIGNSAFENCSSLKGIVASNGTEPSGELVFSSALTDLGTSAFAGCTQINTVNLEASTKITRIPASAFSNSGVQTARFSSGLENILSNAFANCAIQNLYFRNTTTAKITSAMINETAFTTGAITTSKLTIYVPPIVKDAYKEVLDTYFSGATYKDNEYDSQTIKLATTSITDLAIGGSKAVAVTLDAGATESISALADDGSIVDAQIDGMNVVVTGKRLGKTTVTVKTASGKSATLAVTVTANASAADYVSKPITAISAENKEDNTSLSSSITLVQGEQLAAITNPTVGAVNNDAEVTDAVVWEITDATYPQTTSTTANNKTTVSNGKISITYDDTSAVISVVDSTFNGKIAISYYSACTPAQTITITVKPLLTEIAVKDGMTTNTVAYSAATINASSSYFNFTPKDNGEQSKLTYTSSNPAIATITSDGVITPVGIGSTTITVTSPYSKKTAQVTLTITNNIVSATAEKNSYTVLAGESVDVETTTNYTIKDMGSEDTLTWTSSNEKVATVSATATATGHNLTIKTLVAGSAKITATNAAGKTVGTIAVTATGLKLSKTSYSVYSKGPNKSAKIEIATELPDGASVTYAMADSKSKKVASVSSNGTITGKSAGSAKVNVTVNGTNTATCTVKVTEAKLTVSFAGANVKTKTKKKKTTTTYELSRKKLKKKSSISVNANYLGSTKKKVTYKSSKKSVITVDKKGKLKLKKKGSATITVTCNGVSAKYNVKVVN